MCLVVFWYFVAKSGAVCPMVNVSPNKVIQNREKTDPWKSTMTTNGKGRCWDLSLQTHRACNVGSRMR